MTFAGIWLGLPEQQAQHMGTLLCLLDQSLHRSNFGCMDFSCSISASSKAETSKAKTELKKINSALIHSPAPNTVVVDCPPNMALKCSYNILKWKCFMYLAKF